MYDSALGWRVINKKKYGGTWMMKKKKRIPEIRDLKPETCFDFLLWIDTDVVEYAHTLIPHNVLID